MKHSFPNEVPHPAIVRYDYYGDAIYFTKKLKLTERQKLVVFSATFLYSSIHIAVSFILLLFKMNSEAEAKLYDEVKNDEYKGKLSSDIFFPLVLWFLITLFQIFFTYWRYFEEQVVKCSWSNDSSFFIGIYLYMINWADVKQDRFPLSFNSPHEMKIIFNGIGVLGLTVLLSNLFCRYRFCVCKTCRKIKDVKICYMGKTIEVAETNKITSEFLIEQFGIPEALDANLVLYSNSGSRIHTFMSKNYIQLYEGYYNLRKSEFERIESSLMALKDEMMLMPKPPTYEESVREKPKHCIINID